MGLLNWLRNGRTAKTLIRTRYDDPELSEVQRDVAADVAAVEEDDKYFDPRSPGWQEGD